MVNLFDYLLNGRIYFIMYLSIVLYIIYIILYIIYCIINYKLYIILYYGCFTNGLKLLPNQS